MAVETAVHDALEIASMKEGEEWRQLTPGSASVAISDSRPCCPDSPGRSTTQCSRRPSQTNYETCGSTERNVPRTRRQTWTATAGAGRSRCLTEERRRGCRRRRSSRGGVHAAHSRVSFRQPRIPSGRTAVDRSQRAVNAASSATSGDQGQVPTETWFIPWRCPRRESELGDESSLVLRFERVATKREQ